MWGGDEEKRAEQARGNKDAKNWQDEAQKVVETAVSKCLTVQVPTNLFSRCDYTGTPVQRHLRVSMSMKATQHPLTTMTRTATAMTSWPSMNATVAPSFHKILTRTGIPSFVATSKICRMVLM
jgi:hypothetical protein